MFQDELKNLAHFSITSLIVIYGIWELLTDVVLFFIPFSILLSSMIALLIYLLRIPPPNLDKVEAIIGKEPHIGNDETYIMKTIAHRGAGYDAPENSLPAFKLCNDKGCTAIEFDVTLTADDVPIVFHDGTLERLTDYDFNVNKKKWDELRDIDISVKHPLKDRFASTNIPTFEQTVIQLLASGQRMIIDIKDNNMKMVKVINNIFEKYPELYQKAIVSSFFPNIIYLVRRSNPKIICSLAWRPYAFAYDSYAYPQGKGPRRANNFFTHIFYIFCDILHEWALTKITYYLLGISVLLLHKDVISGKVVSDWREKGVRVMAWTVNNPNEKQFLARVLKITYLTDTLTAEGTTHGPSYTDGAEGYPDI